ncbi:sensor histidine kinase [Falsiroseomonas tokyonensis]|uniref:histidine kinase n=1 Tax=Falsiroseomonas tokyonensis TaxID=430521 RepID=A0ABV7BXB8_9PROT|nr:sensor histidine kinase [Falsiroseomonas tokyonensis]MBU8538830.1 sensor histidine kinase [Falsiroseomonas tokyonensis]
MTDARRRVWRLPRPQASLRGRLLCLLLVAAFPVVVLVLAGAFASYRGSIRQAQLDVALERDLVVATLAARVAAADGFLRGVAASWPEAGNGCGDALHSAAPEGVMLEVECPNGVAAPATTSPATSSTTSPNLARIGPELRARLAGATDSLMLAGSAGVISLLRVLPASPRLPAGRLILARVAPPPLPAGLSAWILDADNRGWALGEDGGRLGPVAPATAADGSATLTSLAGTELVSARGRLSPQAMLVVARPLAPIRAEAAMEATQRLAEVAALLALSILAVVLGTNYAVTRPLSRLRRAIAKWNAGAAPLEIPGIGGMPDEIRDLALSFQGSATALAERERDLQAAIERAEILAAEVHHRVKNNLQIVSSLLALQAQRVTDSQARVEFEAARDRIGALATLHRHMYAHHDPEAIDLGAFIEELGVQLFAAIGDKPGRRIGLDVTAPALRISSDQAVPLALIITEAVSAALKQGFPPGRGGRISITVAADDRRASLAIEDDGLVPRPDDQLRALLLRGLARQLGAELKREEAGLALEFPLRAPTPRPPPALRPSASRPTAPPAA